MRSLWTTRKLGQLVVAAVALEPPAKKASRARAASAGRARFFTGGNLAAAPVEKDSAAQQVFLAPVTAFQARPREKSAETRRMPAWAARAIVQSPWRSRQPAPREIDQ